MNVKRLEEKVELPEGVSGAVDGYTLTVNGPKGEVKKIFRDIFVKVECKDNSVVIGCNNATKRQKMILGTFKSHVNNMIQGATEGFVYKLKICSGHFPMNVAFNNGEFIVKNFIGEKVPRTLKVNEKVKLKVEGTDIIIESVDKELAGQTAASIETLTRRTGFDSRVFQAGIYIVDKNGKKMGSN